jgi:hypothetical protein
LVLVVDDACGDHPGQETNDCLLSLFWQRPPALGWFDDKPWDIQHKLGGRG